jgi:alkylated DNA repair dioxygenase AlkB
MENTVHQFISPDFAHFLFDQTMDEQNGSEDVTFVKGSKVQYGNPHLEWLLRYLHPLIEEVYGKKLVPSYAYNRVYKEGQELAPHFDQERAQVGVTITLGYISHYIWPIFVDKTSYSLDVGQGVVYKGNEQLHWRDPFRKINPDEKQDIYWSQAFLFYVEEGGEFDTPDYRYDAKFKRENGIA